MTRAALPFEYSARQRFLHAAGSGVNTSPIQSHFVEGPWSSGGLYGGSCVGGFTDPSTVLATPASPEDSGEGGDAPIVSPAGAGALDNASMRALHAIKTKRESESEGKVEFMGSSSHGSRATAHGAWRIPNEMPPIKICAFLLEGVSRTGASRL